MIQGEEIYDHMEYSLRKKRIQSFSKPQTFMLDAKQSTLLRKRLSNNTVTNNKIQPPFKVFAK